MGADVAPLVARQAVAYDQRYHKVIHYLVGAGYRVNSPDCFGSNVNPLSAYLHFAIWQHFIPDAIQLIKLGADVNRVQNSKGQTALQLAVVIKSHPEPLKIIPNGIEYTKMRFYCLKSFYFATAARNEKRIEELAESRPQDALDSAALHSQRSLVKMLLDAGAEVNNKDCNNCSPIQCAVYTGDLELVKMLIDAGADINNQNRIGATALHDAVLSCNEEMVFLLLSCGADVSIETALPEGNTALHWASMLNIGNSHEGIIRKLLEFGSELLYIPNAISLTPFNYIVQCCDVNLINLCVEEYKADLKKLNNNGHSALTFAVLNVNQNVFDFVWERAGIEIDDESDHGISLFQSACEASMFEYVRRLISLGADLNAANKKDKNPLLNCIRVPHLANVSINLPLCLLRANFAEERRRVIRLLLEYGSDVNQKIFRNRDHEEQWSLLEMMIDYKDFEALNIMIEHVAEVEVRSNERLFDDYNLMVIDEQPEIKSRYQTCQAELTAMRTAKIENTTITYLSVLTEPLDLVARYARNENFVKTFEAGDYQTAYNIYASRLKEKFDAAIVRQKMIEQASSILSTTLQFADSSHPAFEFILEYLSEADVQLLIGSAFSEN